MSPLVRRILFWSALAVLVAAHVAVALQSLFVHRFWEDEAFNLTVPLNLLDGMGYTSDGALSGSTPTPFDPRISTGPSVLVPAAALIGLGLDPVLGARLVPLLYWGLLLAGLWVLGRRIAGPWGGLVAVAAALAFDTTGPSPIQGPADFLGEIPAAALIVWALVVLPRRAWLAGLLLGLAVQAKLIALLALPAFAIAVWALAPGTGWARILATLRRGLLPLVLVGVPTLLVELGALLALGPSGFVDHLRGIVAFVRSGGQSTQPTTVPEKLGWFADAWHVPSVVVLVVTLTGIVLIVLGARRERLDAPRLALLLAAAVGIAAFLGWWSTAAHTPLWIRHPAPGVFAFVPVLAAFTVWGARALWAPRPHPHPKETTGESEPSDDDDRPAPPGSPRSRALLRTLAVVGMVVVGGSTAVGAAQHGVLGLTPPSIETLPDQQAAAEPLRAWVEETDTEWLAAQPWGAPVSMVVLSGAHVGLFDAPAMASAPRLGFDCSTTRLVRSRPYVICAAPE